MQNKYIEVKDSGVEWVGKIPVSWRIMRGKNCLHVLSRPILESDEIITCFRDGEVTLRKNRREEGFTNALLECGYQGVEPGDLVVHGMDGFAGAIGISDSRGKASPVLNVLDSDQNKRFIMYYLRALAVRNVFLALSTGIRVRSCDLRWNKLATIPYVLPPFAEQSAIADYLDEKCGAIDEIIEQAKATIEEYKAWKSSVIFEAVTKGLDPNVEMKDSGVEWIGQVPKHWSIEKAKHCVTIDHGSDPKSEGDTPVYGSGASSFKTCGEFKEGPTVLVGRKGATLHIPHFIEGKYWNVDTAFDVKSKSNLRLRFYYYLAICFDYKYYMSQTTLPGMTQTNYLNMKIPVPKLIEQDKIIIYLDRKCSAIDEIIAEKEALIADMEAYKKSLIFESVTGKRKVC